MGNRNPCRLRCLAAVLAVVALAAGCSGGSETAISPGDGGPAEVTMIPTAPSPTAGGQPGPAPTPTTTAPETTVIPTAIPTPAEPESPWIEQVAVPVDAVPAFVARLWRSGDSTSCPALFPVGLAEPHPEATLRAGDFGGDWNAIWDLPDGPGRAASGEYCPDCGRSSFGIAPLGLEPSRPPEPQRTEGSLRWADGSTVHWFFEGFADAGTGAPLLAHLYDADSGCSYQAWTFAGEKALVDLIGRLRRVETLGAPGPAEPAPWEAASIELDDPHEVYAQEWDEAGCPPDCLFLAFAELGPELTGAAIRRAENAGEMLVAWDLPDGPGHDTFGEPCTDCGRGVIGLGTFQSAELPGEPNLVWSDGSAAVIEPGLYGHEARLRPAGSGCIYWIWSHLGRDHLLAMIERLRAVDESM